MGPPSHTILHVHVSSHAYGLSRSEGHVASTHRCEHFFEYTGESAKGKERKEGKTVSEQGRREQGREERSEARWK